MIWGVVSWVRFTMERQRPCMSLMYITTTAVLVGGPGDDGRSMVKRAAEMGFCRKPLVKQGEVGAVLRYDINVTVFETFVSKTAAVWYSGSVSIFPMREERNGRDFCAVASLLRGHVVLCTAGAKRNVICIYKVQRL